MRVLGDSISDSVKKVSEIVEKASPLIGKVMVVINERTL